MADGSIRIETTIDNKKAFKDLEELKEKLEQNESELSESQFVNYQQQIEELKRTTQEYFDMLNEYPDLVSIARDNVSQIKDMLRQEEAKLEVMNTNSTLYEQQKQKVAQLKEELRVMNGEVKMYSDGLEKASVGWEKNQLKAEKLNARLNDITNRTMERQLQAQQRAEQLKTNAMMDSANATRSAIGRNVGTIRRYIFSILSIRSAYSLVSQASRQWLNSENANAQQAKANIEAVTNALTNLLAPAISFIADMLMYIIALANIFTKTFLGIDLMAKSVNKSTKGIGGGLNKASKGAKKLGKEMKRTLAPFDEVQKLTKDTSDNLGGGAGGGGGAGMPVTPKVTPDLSAAEKAVRAFLDKVKGWLDSIMSTETFQSYANSIATIATNTFDLIKSISSNIWDNVLLSWQEMFPHLQSGFYTMIEFWRRVLEDMSIASTTWFPIIAESVNKLVDAIFNTFRPLTTFMARVWSELGEIMLQLWNEYGLEVLNGMLEFVNSMIEIATSIWTNVIDPILAPILQEVERLWDEHIKDLLIEFGKFIGDLITGTLEIINKVIKPIVVYLLEKLAPIIRWIADIIVPLIGNSFAYVFDQVKNIVKMLRGIFNGLVDFIVGVFTGNWARAWHGVVNIFKSIVNGIANIFKAPLNWMIDGINVFLRGLNKIKLPKWVPGVGGKGFNISPIPRLAKGGIISRPEMILAGEGGGREIVAPLDRNTGWIDELAEKINEASGTQIIRLEVDGKTLAEVVNNSNSRMNFRTNGGGVL